MTTIRARSTPAQLPLLLPLLLLLAAASSVAAQGSADETTEAGSDTPTARSSARGTMRDFLETFYQTREELGADPLQRAAEYLDLSGVPAAIRPIRGPELAAELKAILDRTERIDFATVPADPDAPPFSIDVHRVGRVTLAPDAHGEWRFTSETVSAIPRLYRAVERLEIVEGVEEAPRTLSMWLRSGVPASLRPVGFLLEHWQWLALLLLVIAGVVIDRLVTAALHLAVRRWLGRHIRQLAASDLQPALRPVGLAAAALVWWAGLLALGLPTGVLQVLSLAVKVVGATAAVWAAYRAVDVLSSLLQARAESTESRFDDLLVPMIRKTAKVFIASFGLVFIADNLDADITSLLAGLGIGGIAVALAAQDTVKNLFGSMMVVVDQPFHVGDWVVVGDIEGTVAEVGFRSTRIRTFYDSLVTVPNATLMTVSIDNYGARQYRRWKTMLSLPYSTPAEKTEAFCEGVRELVRRHPHTRKDYFHVYFNSFAPASLDVLLYIFFEVPDWTAELQARQQLGLDILRLAESLDVEFAFPTQTLYLHRPPPAPPQVDVGGYAGRVATAREEGRAAARRLVGATLEEPASTPGGSSADEVDAPGGERA